MNKTMNVDKEIERHEAAIVHLEAIKTIKSRIVGDIKYYNHWCSISISSEWTKKRIKINKDILKRITKSYKKLYA